MKKVRRMVAMLTVVVIAALIIGTLICAVTGSRYFFGMLFLTFAVPVVLWVFMWFTNLLNGKSEVILPEDMELSEKAKKDGEES
ncbi:MAG: hypothetical protein NC347_02445 [Clostridium sp.]|nr:hypothetical protein [Clostridium sp.]